MNMPGKSLNMKGKWVPNLSPSAQAFLDILLKLAPKEKALRGIGSLMDKIMAQEKEQK
jgi:hypothetical protein